MQIFGDENVIKGKGLEVRGEWAKGKSKRGQFNCPETTKKEKAGCYPAELTKQKDGSGEPMSEYDSDAMDKATGGKNATERDNQHIMRGQWTKERRRAKDPRTERRKEDRRNTAGSKKKGKIVRARRDKNTARGRTKNRVIELSRRRLENPEE